MPSRGSSCTHRTMNCVAANLFLPPAAQQTGSVASAYSKQAKEILQILSSIPEDKRGQLLLDLQAETDWERGKGEGPGEGGGSQGELGEGPTIADLQRCWGSTEQSYQRRR